MKIFHCKQCEQEFKRNAGNSNKFCSRSCYYKSMIGKVGNIIHRKSWIAWNKGLKHPEQSGEKHFRWKGGVSRGYKTGYYSAEYKNWRKAVFKRDDYACVDCGYRGFITAHHIKSFAYYPELRYELSNGKTLCEECHKKTDNYKGRAKRIGRAELVLTNK